MFTGGCVREPVARPARPLLGVPLAGALLVGALLAGLRPVAAQAAPAGADTVRRPAPARPDTATSSRGPRRQRAGAAPREGLRPPISPRRAFFSSALLPGLGQSRLGRPTAGAVFAGVELASLAMLAKTLGDLRAAKAVRADSVPTAFPVDSLGRPVPPTARTVAPFTNDLVRARRLHLEDWIAAVLFNHLISGAEAFVSANLYDLPAQISARPNPRGGAVVAVSVAW